jgi:hypothetical protein
MEHLMLAIRLRWKLQLGTPHQRSYIKKVPAVVTDAMKKLEAEIACTGFVQQESSSSLVN